MEVWEWEELVDHPFPPGATPVLTRMEHYLQ